MQERPGLLLVTRNMPPLRGGMERLNARLAAELSRYMDVIVVGPHGSDLLAAPGIEVMACPRPGLAAFLVWSMWTACRVARRRRPHWILGGSGLAAPAVMSASLVSGAHRAIYLHGLDIVARHPLYRAVWLPAIRRMHALIANSRNTAALAARAGVDTDRMDVVVPGVEPPLPPDPQAGSEFRKRHGLAHRKILLSVGRLTERKGLRTFVEQALPSILSRHPDALLLVVGDAAPDALLRGPHDMRKQVDEAISRLQIGDSVRFLGPVNEDELHAAYEASNLHVFPVVDRPGDVEGFGMVAIEAAAHGRSTVAFAVGGVPDAVREGESGYLIAQGDYAAFAAKVSDALELGPESSAEQARKFAGELSWERFGMELARALARHETRHD